MLPDPVWLNAAAMLISSVAALIWAIRRRP
jgi:hypothetical protein